MKIQVIDNIDQIQPLMLMAEADVAFYSDEIQALNAAEQLQPNIILLNFALRGSQTPDYTNLLLAASPTSNIVIIGDDLHEEQILHCVLAGAKGYQNSQSLAAYINRMIHAVATGEAWLSRKIVAYLLDAIHRNYSLQASS
ncbi:response regulator transcription factor [Methylomonas sp. BW4-1]|uniref:Response regulator transcription factor n=1 Tax=Methylomonas defluvii TaxID=3045149 RepID=A0ABU4U9U6_9GAMM|nr:MULTISPECIES: response regulator transcription factor [unclassified Methylomonas]MDX8126186.1 response regulator transcription factor [Methylomonas sp. OY6]QSB02187.1 response regulator transcription factor [Methylomonas sp. EFPC1]